MSEPQDVEIITPKKRKSFLGTMKSIFKSPSNKDKESQNSNVKATSKSLEVSPGIENPLNNLKNDDGVDVGKPTDSIKHETDIEVDMKSDNSVKLFSVYDSLKESSKRNESDIKEVTDNRYIDNSTINADKSDVTTNISSANNKVGLHILRIECLNLDNVEILSHKNDVYCELKWSDQQYVTDVLNNIGENATFDDMDMFIYPTADLSSTADSLEIIVKDYNKFRSHVEIGSVKALLPNYSTFFTSLSVNKSKTHVTEELRLLLQQEREQIIQSNITNTKGKISGQVNVTYKFCVMADDDVAGRQARVRTKSTHSKSGKSSKGEIVDNPRGSVLSINNRSSFMIRKPSDAQIENDLVLHLHRIECAELLHVEKRKEDKNDVYVTLKWSTAEVKTETLEESGHQALYDASDMFIYPRVLSSADSSVAELESLEIIIKDKNNFLMDTLIGSVKVSLAAINMTDIINNEKNSTTGAGSLKTSPYVLETDVFTKKGARAGHVRIQYAYVPYDTMLSTCSNNKDNNNNSPVGVSKSSPTTTNAIAVVPRKQMGYFSRKNRGSIHTYVNTNETEALKKKFDVTVAYEVALSKQYEAQNMTLFFCVVITIFVILLGWILKLFQYLFKLEIANKYWNAKTSVYAAVGQTIFILFALSQTAHRLVAHALGVILRYALRQSYTANRHLFDIHIGWVSYRGFMDHNQLVIHNILWRNPPEFKDTPYLLRIRQLSVSFNPFNLVSFHKNGELKGLEFGDILIDGFELYFEKANTDDAVFSLNVWAAIGASDKDSQKNVLRNIIIGKY